MSRRKLLKSSLYISMLSQGMGCSTLIDRIEGTKSKSGNQTPSSKNPPSSQESAEYLQRLVLECSDRPDSKEPRLVTPDNPLNVYQFESAARSNLPTADFLYLACGSEENLTLNANRNIFKRVQTRSQRLVNVEKVDTSVELFGTRWKSPIFLSPCGLQSVFHKDAELATGAAASNKQHLLMVSTVASKTYWDIKKVNNSEMWFQLYPTTNRRFTKKLINRIEKAGCKTLVLTVDTPVLGKRDKSAVFNEKFKKIILAGGVDHFNDMNIKSAIDPTLTWRFVAWLRENTQMNIVLKGIVTRYDAKKALNAGVDGVMVSNHGGRQEDSGRSSFESLIEVKSAIGNQMPILFDGGVRRGNDVFKALAAGATAVGIGRPYLWGLSAFGQKGVEAVLDLTQSELVRTIQFAGTPKISRISKSHITKSKF